MTQDYMKKKELMITEIVNNTDLYKSKSEFTKMSFAEVKSIYDSCMIPFLKKINNTKTK
jgi:hypothetical protein